MKLVQEQICMKQHEKSKIDSIMFQNILQKKLFGSGRQGSIQALVRPPEFGFCHKDKVKPYTVLKRAL